MGTATESMPHREIPRRNGRQSDGASDAADRESTDRPSRVAVTGATGFVGSHLSEYLVREGCAVRAICRATSNTRFLEDLGVDVVRVDWEAAGELEAAVADCDVVYHLAAVTHAVRAEEYYHCNTGFSAALAEVCGNDSRRPTLVLCSSIAAIGPSGTSVVERPVRPPAPVSHYGKSKRGGELAATLWSTRLPLTVVRPGIVFGPRNRELLPVFRSIYRYRLHVAPSLRSAALSWIHVDDLVEILWRAARWGARAELPKDDPHDGVSDRGIYIASAPEWIDYHRFGKWVGEALERRCMVVGCPQPVSWLAAWSGEAVARLTGDAPPLTVDKMREASSGSWAFSDDRIRTELGFSFPCSIKERIRETARWYLQNGWL